MSPKSLPKQEIVRGPSRAQKENAAKLLREGKEKERYEIAQKKAEAFLKKIDPNLIVAVSERKVELYDRTSFVGLVLSFTHKTDPKLRWTMSVGADPGYIENKLETVVRKIYSEKKKEVTATASKGESKSRDFGSQEFPELKGKERPQTLIEQELINQADTITNSILKRYGFPEVAVSREVVHIIKKDEWRGEGSAVHVSHKTENRQAILIQETEKKLILKKKLIHEMFHLKLENLLPHPLIEALVESLTIEAIKKHGKDPLTRKELRVSAELTERFGDEQTEEGEPLFTEDTFLAYVDKDGRINSENHTYGKERRVLGILTDKMHSSGRFTSKDEAFSVLVSAEARGDKDALRVFDECFGDGTLQKMYDIGDNVDMLEKFVGSLQVRDRNTP